VTSLTAGTYAKFLVTARRHSRVAGEADDLLHDALAVAVERGRLDVAGVDGPWLSGVIANLALRRARDAVRRRRRERVERPESATPPMPPRLPDARWVRTLPPSARVVATLALNGMTPREIKHVLALSDAAYRQRLTSVRRAYRSSTLLPPDTEPSEQDEPSLDLGLIRRHLLVAARRRGVIGAHDPDGNLFLIGSSHLDRLREQAGDADD
jgi:RNA polymerase sigma-70 factor (ECF subfamily)